MPQAAEPGWALSFDYPGADAAGRPVRVERGPEDAPFERIHVMAADEDEIYFEVRRRAGRTTAEAYDILREHLPRQHPDVTFSRLAPRDLAGRVAHECTFRWADEERHVVFVEAGGAMYRIIFRPGSEINWAILDSVTIDAP